MKYIREHNITGQLATDEIEYGLGSIYPMPGGLKENVYWFLGRDVYIRQIEGEKHVYRYLDAHKEDIAKCTNKELFIDALNCGMGCLYGTAVEESKAQTDDALYAISKIGESSKSNKKTTWGAFYVEFTEKKVEVEPYEYYEHDFRVRTDADTAVKILSGEVSPVAASEEGKAIVEGDAGKLALLEKYLKADVVEKKTTKAATKAPVKAEKKPVPKKSPKKPAKSTKTK